MQSGRQPVGPAAAGLLACRRSFGLALTGHRIGGVAGATAEALNGTANLARAVGNGTTARAGYGNLNLAFTSSASIINANNQAYAGHGNGNLAAVFGTGSTATAGGNLANPTGNDRNSAIVIGNISTATAGPGTRNHVFTLGSNKNNTKP